MHVSYRNASQGTAWTQFPRCDKYVIEHESLVRSSHDRVAIIERDAPCLGFRGNSPRGQHCDLAPINANHHISRHDTLNGPPTMRRSNRSTGSETRVVSTFDWDAWNLPIRVRLVLPAVLAHRVVPRYPVLLSPLEYRLARQFLSVERRAVIEPALHKTNTSDYGV